MPTAADKVLQYLEEAHALEAGLASTLTAHAAMTPRGDYRDLIERHRDETRAQVERIQSRLVELGQSQSLAHVVYGAAQTALGQTTALALAPLNVLRGTGGEEKLLKNAKDEVASEALEIATYDALEALADAVGDEKTAVLAREHRTQEELFMKHLREVIPALTHDVLAADVEGDPSFDISTIGAADAARSAAAKAYEAASKAASTAKGRVSRGADAVEEQVDEAADAVSEAVTENADKATQKVAKAADEAQSKVQSVADKAETKVDKATDEVEAEVDEDASEAADTIKQVAAKADAQVKRGAAKAGTAAKKGTATAAGKAKSATSKASVKAKEGAADAADSTTDAADSVQKAAEDALGGREVPTGFPIVGYDALSADQVVRQLEDLDTDALAMVDGYERGGKDRKRVLDRISALRQRKVDEQLANTGA